jgi:hypothetical protein
VAQAVASGFPAPGFAAPRSNPCSDLSRIFGSALGARLGNLHCGKLVDETRSEDQDETNGGKSNRVSFRLQAWRFIIAAPLIKGRTLPQIPGGSFLASIGGSLLKSAEGQSRNETKGYRESHRHSAKEALILMEEKPIDPGVVGISVSPSVMWSLFRQQQINADAKARELTLLKTQH